VLLPENSNVSFEILFAVFVFMNTREWIETKSFMVQDPKILTKRKEGLVRPVTQSFLFCDTQNNSQYAKYWKA